MSNFNYYIFYNLKTKLYSMQEGDCQQKLFSKNISSKERSTVSEDKHVNEEALINQIGTFVGIHRPDYVLVI